MKTLRILSLALFMLGIVVCGFSTAYAAMHPLINYQGRLTDKQGKPLDEVYNIKLKIYDALTGAGTIAWEEKHDNVSIQKGIFSVLLGSKTPLDDLAFDQAYYLEVAVCKSGTDNYEIMTPRQQITWAAYAIRAENGVPKGVIVMWSGAIAEVPSGWALCDGTKGTPNLKDRFIVGAGNTYNVAATGGEAMHTLTIAEMPAHAHPYMKGVYHSESDGLSGAFKSNQDDNTGSVGGGQPHENRPPYYALAYIMKL